MERLYNNLIKCISISVKQAIEESIGTLQIDNNIDKIYNDIENHIYKNNKISYNDYKNIIQFNEHDNLYMLTYNDICNIKNLQIIICENPNIMYTEAAALIDNKEYTILGSDEIILATLIIYNPDELRFLKNHLYHEIRHYYDTFKHINSYSGYDRGINYLLNKEQKDNKTYNINFLQFKKMLMNNNIPYPLLQQAILSQLYYLDESEIRAHAENMFGEIDDYFKHNNIENNSLENISETYNFYKSIKDVFTYYKDNLSETYIKWLVKNFGDDFYEIYYGKIGHPKSFNFVFKKIIYNCNKFFKHAEQMKIYCKNKYEK